MCKLVNRIKYGKTDKPKFIKSKSSWLYKNKWISNDVAYEILSDKTTRYTYELMIGEVSSFGELDSFDAIVDLAMRYPTQINFPDLKQFSMQEIDILLGIQKKYVEEQSKKIRKNITEMNEEIEKIQARLWR